MDRNFQRAESYKVYAVEHAGTAKALKAITDTVPENAGEPVTTAETTVRFHESETGYILCIYDRRGKPQ